MGTNYYVEEKPPCECCGRGYDRLHIGKSSAGWKFLFAPYPELGLTSWTAWQAHLEGGAAIFDEYGRRLRLEELRDIIEKKQRPDMLDAANAPLEKWGSPPGFERDRFETADPQGYRFSTSADFS